MEEEAGKIKPVHREVIIMNNFITIDKRSKKAKKEYYSMQRRTWGEISPVTRTVPSGKVYSRKNNKIEWE